MKRLAVCCIFVLTMSSCSKSFLLDGTNLSLSSWSGLTWEWVDSGFEENATKELVYEEQFGEGNTIRLHQSMSVFDDVAFCFNHGNECRIYDLKTKDQFYAEPLPDKSHHNNAQFSNVFFEQGDRFPLLILSRGDYPPNPNDFYVVRVQENEGRYSFSIVKTIHNSIREAIHNGSWVIDEDHNKLFLYCMTTGDYRVKENNHFCIYSFNLPDITDPEDITLGYEDVLDKWEYTYLIHQGGTYYNGFLLFNVQSLSSVEGKEVVSSKSVIAINATSGHIDIVLPLDDSKETEGISVFDNCLYVSFKEGNENQSFANTVFTLNAYSLPASIIKRN